MKKVAAWVIMLVFALGLCVGLYFNKSQAIQTSTAAVHEFTTFIEGAGAVSAPTQVIVTPMAGTVKGVSVEEGQFLRQGSPVLQMDDDILKLQLQEALLALNAQKKLWIKQNGQLSRKQQEAAMLAAQQTGYGITQFNDAANGQNAEEISSEQVDLARVKVQQASRLMKDATVLSALSGVVMDVTVRPGELVSAGTKAAIIAAMDQVEIESVFADQDAADIQPGMEVELYGGCLGSVTSVGVVTQTAQMSQSQQAQTGPKSMAVVRIKPENASMFNRLGASVELRVITGRKTAMGVPIEALAQDSSGLFVYVIRNGRAYRAPVEVGVLDETHAEVRSGIRAGDVLALNPTELRNGERVSVS